MMNRKHSILLILAFVLIGMLACQSFNILGDAIAEIGRPTNDDMEEHDTFVPGLDKQTGEDDSSAGTCFAHPDMFEVEMMEPEYTDNEDFSTCYVLMYIRNKSDETLKFNYYEIYTTYEGDQDREGWKPAILDPAISSEHEHALIFDQYKTKGQTSIDTITKIVFSLGTPECANFLDLDNQAEWEPYVYAVEDPCNPER